MENTEKKQQIRIENLENQANYLEGKIEKLKSEKELLEKLIQSKEETIEALKNN